MKENEIYVHVTIKKGDKKQQTWIPKRGGIVGAIIEIKENGVMDPGWKVLEVKGETTKDKLKNVEHCLRNHKGVTDI